MNREAVLAAVGVVLDGTGDAGVISQANDLLIAFQKTPDVWSWCLNVVSTPPSAPVQWFAANMLLRKIQRHSGQLDNGKLVEMYDILLPLALTVTDKKVSRELCSSIATLSMYLQGKLSQLFEIWDPSNVPLCKGMIHILLSLPEELNADHLTLSIEEKDNQCRILEANLIPCLVKFAQATQCPELRLPAFMAMSDWISFGSEVFTTENLGEIVTALLPLFIGGLADEDLVEVAVSCLRDLTRAAWKWKDYPELATHLIESITGLTGQFSAASEYQQHALCRLLADVATTYVTFCIHLLKSESPLGHASMESVLLCAASDDPEIVFLTFDFWFAICDITTRDNDQVAISKLSPYLIRLMEQLRVLNCFPDDFDELEQWEVDEHKDLRYDASLVLQDVCSIIPQEACLNVVQTQLYNSRTWQEAEAALYLLRCMARSINVEECTSLPTILSSLQTLPDHYMLRYTAVLVVGRYSDWAARHPEYIPALFSFVMNGFSDGNTTVRGAAALSLRYLCNSCALHLQGDEQLHSLFTAYYHILGNKLLGPDDVLEVIEAICLVISASKAEVYPDLLLKLVTPILESLRSSSDADQLMLELKRVAHVLKTLEVGNGANALKAFIEQFWVTSAVLFDTHYKDSHIMEELCRVYKYAIRLLKYDIPVTTVLYGLLQKIVVLYAQVPCASYLYIVSICVSEYGKAPELAGVLSELLTILCPPTISLLSTADQYVL